MRRASKVDVNQPAIVRDIRKVGYSVGHTHTVGDGFPDIVVGAHGQNFMFEIKDPDKVPSARALTDDEKAFHLGWNGQIHIIHSAQEAFDVINATIHRHGGDE